MNTMVEALVFRLGPHLVALELQKISSVLAVQESEGMERLDPRPYLYSAAQADELRDKPEDRVGLLLLDGPPMVLFLGEILGTLSLSNRAILPLPKWMARGIPEILHPGITLWEEEVVWLLNLDTLRRAEFL